MKTDSYLFFAADFLRCATQHPLVVNTVPLDAQYSCQYAETRLGVLIATDTLNHLPLEVLFSFKGDKPAGKIRGEQSGQERFQKGLR